MKQASFLGIFLLACSAILCAEKADLIIFSYDRPLQLWALLESVEKNIKNIGDVSVIYRASSDEFVRGYMEVQDRFDSVVYIRQSNDPKSDFKPLTMQCLENGKHAHLFFAVDDIVVTRAIDLEECIQALEESNAYAFYMRLGTNLTSCYPMQSLQQKPQGTVYKNQFFMWQFKSGQYDWNYPHSVDMTLYRKKQIMPQLYRMPFTSPNTLEGQWSSQAGHTYDLFGVCYLQAPMINLPLNLVQNDWQNRNMDFMTTQELLLLFNTGLKMDINPLQGLVNDAAHMEYIPSFIER